LNLIAFILGILDVTENCQLFILNFFEVLQSSLQEQQRGLNYLSTTVKEMSKKAPSDISRKYQSEFEDIESCWKKLSSQLVEHCQKLEEQMNKLRKIQVFLGFAFHICSFTYFLLNDAL
jgi:predicted RNase H-like nuclease (RuvC/YqgF family)